MKEKVINVIKLVFIICVFFCLSGFTVSILSFIGLDVSKFDQSDIVLLDSVMEIILAVIIFALYSKTFIKDFHDYMNGFSKNFRRCLMFFILFLLIKISSGVIEYVLSFILNVAVTDSENQTVINTYTTSAPLLMLFSASFVAPFVEEGIFRLGFKKIINNPTAFILISGIVFGLMHIFPTSVSLTIALLESITYIAMGITLAYMYNRTGNIWCTILIHCLNNLLSMLILLA